MALGVIVNARVVEMEKQKGWGKAELEDGRVLNFDVTVSKLGVPVVGAAVEVEVGPSRMGGEKIVTLEILPWWEPTTLPFLFLEQMQDGVADLIYAREGQLIRETEPLSKSSGPEMGLGEMGLLVLELKRGSATFTETRVVKWWREEVDAGHKSYLLRLFKKLVVEEWEDWNHPDGCHCDDHRRSLQRDLYLGIDLGIELSRFLSIRDYPNAGSGSAYEEMRPEESKKVVLPRPSKMN
jgi:hypothetical protein